MLKALVALMKVMTVSKLDLQATLIAAWLKNIFFESYATKQLGSRSTFLTITSFPFVPNKNVIYNLKLGFNKAVTIEDIVYLALPV